MIIPSQKAHALDLRMTRYMQSHGRDARSPCHPDTSLRQQGGGGVIQGGDRDKDVRIHVLTAIINFRNSIKTFHLCKMKLQVCLWRVNNISFHLKYQEDKCEKIAEEFPDNCKKKHKMD